MSFVKACAVGDVASGAAIAVELEGVDLAVMRDGDDWYAVVDECSHAAIPLSEGDVEGCEIECWLHGSRFDLRSGHPTGLPANRPVPTYPVKIDGDDVLVAVNGSES
jgi:3-phenylpropionate/trans-cinnamate dioxygenase ferredoxin subunit